MSAVLKDIPQLQPMREDELADVTAIEKAIYTHPWTQGNFVDSLRAGYECRTWRLDGELVGYFVLMAAAGEAHLLNLSIAEPHQRRGHGARRPASLERSARRTCFSRCGRATARRRASIRASVSARSRCAAATTRRTPGARMRSC